MSQNLSDETLMLQLASGNESAFEQLYGRHRDALYFYIRYRCGSTVIADDLFQEVWESLFRKAAQYSVQAQFKTYLFTIARNRLTDYYRRQSLRQTDSFSEDVLPVTDNWDQTHLSETEISVDLESKKEQILSIVEVLPTAQREAFLLYMAGLSLAEIADTTKVTKETAKSRVRYAKRKLMQQLRGA